jgi:hypothetical protein
MGNQDYRSDGKMANRARDWLKQAEGDLPAGIRERPLIMTGRALLPNRLILAKGG